MISYLESRTKSVENKVCKSQMSYFKIYQIFRVGYHCWCSIWTWLYHDGNWKTACFAIASFANYVGESSKFLWWTTYSILQEMHPNEMNSLGLLDHFREFVGQKEFWHRSLHYTFTNWFTLDVGHLFSVW